MKVAICVPRRADNGHRDRLWEFARKRWESDFPDWPICEGVPDPDVPFNRSQALNRAVESAGDAEVFLLIDADVLCNRAAVATGVEVAKATGQMVVTHDERVMLSRQGTEKVLGGYTGPWRTPQMHERVWQDSVSCSVAVSRDLWDLVGGFDELFVGWGREDTAFRIACEAFTGKPVIKLTSEVFHLWHAESPEAKRQSPIRKANEQRHQRYVEARWNAPAVRALMDEARLSAAGIDLSPTTIPRILHRTVPTETSPEVEQFWSDFRRLHPGWDLRTWRDPIDPANFPITSSSWERCENGAQLAGLVRLEALWHHGGVYVDSDVRPVRSLEPLLNLPAFAAWEDETTVPDAVLAAPAQHPAWEVMLEKALAAVKARKGAWESGPGVTTSVLPGRNDVLLLPPGSFYPAHYLEKSKLGTSDDKPWIYAEHLWAHSWGSDTAKASIARRQR